MVVTVTVAIAIMIVVTVIVPVVAVPITVGTPLMAAWIVPAVGFAVATLPFITQAVPGFLSLTAFSAMLTDFMAIAIMRFVHSAFAS